MEEEKVLVLDASVAVKWFNVEPLREKALTIRNRYASGEIELIAPDLLHHEVASALKYNPRFGIEDVDALRRSLCFPSRATERHAIYSG
ncbi:MAG: type II toxin-antitoxin system VapC family toxin [Candidatus Caldarchaeum sp.]